MANILVTGGSGLIGQQLYKLLISEGFEVGYLTRSKTSDTSGIKYFSWDPEHKVIDPHAIPWANHIIHLAGETVGQRWTSRVKQRILASRVDSTQLLVSELSKNNHRLKSFVSASAIGYYGDDTTDEVLTEASQKGEGFLSDVVEEWEAAVDNSTDHAERVVKIRNGIVLTPEGGALAKMATPIRYGVGSALGSGKQWMSWIHIDDLCRMFLSAIHNSLEGVYNGVAPKPITNIEFTKILAKKLNRALILPKVPAFALKVLFG